MTRKHSMGTDVLEKTQYVHKNQTKIYEKNVIISNGTSETKIKIYIYIYEDVCIYKKLLRKCNKKLSNVNTQFNCDENFMIC